MFRLRNGFIVLTGLGLAAVGGVAALSHHAQPAPAASYAFTPSSPSYTNAPAVSAVSPFGNSQPAPVVQATPEQTPVAVTPVRVHRARRVRRSYYTRHTYVVTHTRSRKHSLEIIGGSAAGGALIGALAGGGKGAAIGALAGGGGGFIYDRLTRKKKRVVTR